MTAKTGAQRMAEHRIRIACGLTQYPLGLLADAVKFHLIAIGILTETEAADHENCRRALETMVTKIVTTSHSAHRNDAKSV
jgi:hypothetical protein